jgi:hypothetical protein
MACELTAWTQMLARVAARRHPHPLPQDELTLPAWPPLPRPLKRGPDSCGQSSADLQEHEPIPLTADEIRRLLTFLAQTPVNVPGQVLRR